MAQWRALEPNNTSGIDISENEQTKPVYAVFVTGSFTGFRGAGGGTGYDGARIVFDGEGNVLEVRDWQSEFAPPSFTSADPPFGSDYDQP